MNREGGVIRKKNEDGKYSVLPRAPRIGASKYP